MERPLPLEIDITTYQNLCQAGEALVLLDVREDWELDICQIKGSLNLPMSGITGRLDELPQRDALVVVVCHHGGRSLQVTQWLRQQGWTQAASLAGGIDAWAAEVDGTMARY